MGRDIRKRLLRGIESELISFTDWDDDAKAEVALAILDLPTGQLKKLKDLPTNEFKAVASTVMYHQASF